MATIERLRIETVEPVHPYPDVRVGRLDGDVVVVRHQTVRLALPVEAPDDVSKDGEEEQAIVIGEEDGGSAVPSGAGVIERILALDSVSAGDRPTVRGRPASVSSAGSRICADIVRPSVQGLSPVPGHETGRGRRTGTLSASTIR